MAGSVSALMPAYRHAGFVGEALDGIAAQTLRPHETIVVDDGSPDRTAEVVAGHALRGLRLIRQENRGAHAALDRALDEARGEWLAILNSDDAWHPEWIERALGSAAATGAALVFGPIDWIDAAGTPLASDHPSRVWYDGALESAYGRDGTVAAGAELGRVLRTHNFAVTTSNFFLHRSLAEALGGFRDWRWVHDLDFLLRALHHVPSRVRFDPHLPAVRYRVHDRNTISEDTDRALAERARMLEEVEREGAPNSLRERVRGWVRDAVMGPGEGGSGGGVAVAAAVDGWRPRLSSGGSGGPAPGSPSDSAAGDPLRIGIVTPSLDAGGLEEVVALLAEGLRAAGAEIRVRAERGGSVADRLADVGIPVSIGPAARLDAWLSAERPVVLSTHFVGPELLETAAAAGIPAVETVHNVYAWFRDVEWQAERRKATAAAAVIAVSEEAAEYWSRAVSGAGGRDPALTVISNAVHPERMAAPPRATARACLGLPAEARVLAHVGRISVQKNQAGIARAFERAVDSLETSPEVSPILLLVGADAEDGTRERLEAEFAEALRAGRIRIPGAHPNPVVVHAACDAFVANSLFEGWSVSASEAAWVGRPLILGECGGVAGLLARVGASGRPVPHPLGDPLKIAPPDLTADRTRDADVDTLAAAIGEVLRGEVPDPEVAELGRVRTSLSPEEMCSRYLEVLSRVALSSARDPG